MYVGAEVGAEVGSDVVGAAEGPNVGAAVGDSVQVEACASYAAVTCACVIAPE